LVNTARHDSARWRALLVACCLGIAALVAACGGSDSSSSSGSGSGGGSSSSSTKKVDMAAELKKPATITVWAWTPGTDKAVAMFEAAHPNIKVKLQNVGQGPPHYRKLRTVLKSGKGLPDVVHMEFQYIPSFTLTKSLLDMTPYLPDNFLSGYPEWIQKQINVDNGIYGIPWDTGPLGFIYRKDLVEQAGIKTPIKTWADFATAAEQYHKKFPKSYLTNLPGGQTGQWMGLFWQAGARPFNSDPNNLKVDLTSDKIKQVTEYWDKLYANGSISHDADFADAWYQGFSKGKYAGWISAAWGPIFLQDYTKSSKGKWQAQPLPQWNEGENISGNWGGSTLAVLKDSPNKAAAVEFARWILTNQQPVEMFSYERFLFPPQNEMLKNDTWLTKKYPFYGGQEVNKVYANAASVVDKTWQWPPILEYVATQGDDIKSKSVDQGKGATAALQPWQDAVVNYAKQQGLKVQGQ
jgi:multiple sugar transport system substrate-binding protein